MKGYKQQNQSYNLILTQVGKNIRYLLDSFDFLFLPFFFAIFLEYFAVRNEDQSQQIKALFDY